MNREISNPMREVLRAMTGKEPPDFVRGTSTNGYTDEEYTQLQDWCADSVRPTWLTGIGLIEAAESQIAVAIGNGNIQPL